jgi:hypothetical protein
MTKLEKILDKLPAHFDDKVQGWYQLHIYKGRDVSSRDKWVVEYKYYGEQRYIWFLELEQDEKLYNALIKMYNRLVKNKLLGDRK